MQHLRSLAVLVSLCFAIGCGSVRNDLPDADHPVGDDDVTDPDGPPPSVTPDAALGTTPDAPPVSTQADAALPPPPPDAESPPPPPPDAPPPPPPPECTTNAQCGGSTPFCVAEHCVQCATDSACPSTAPVCSTDHVCTGCASDSDCAALPGQMACSPSGACVECVNNADCGGATPYCVANQCEECNGDAACTPSEPVCSGSAHTCGGCAIDADCSLYPATPNCGPGGACVECANNADCGGGTPYCVANRCEECNGASSCSASEPVCSTSDYTCGGCTADADCSLYAATPNCAPGGACVECVNNADCSGTSPICAAQECRACQAGSECGSGECHLDTGACYAGSELIYLSPTGDDANGCTKSAKCKTLARALQLVTATKHTITLASGSYTIAATTALTSDVTVLGHGATIAGTITVNSGSASFFDLTMDGPYNQIACAAAASCRFERITTNIWVSGAGNITLVDFASTSAFSTTGTITIARSSFTDSLSGSMATGGWDITNTIFARNFHGLSLATPTAGRPHRFDNNTVVDNASIWTTSEVIDLKCVGSGLGSFRNNIVWSSFPPGSGSSVTTGCPLTYSLAYSGTSTAYPGTGNILGDPAFVRLHPTTTLPADFHLTAASVARDTADPASPLADDMDGDARPVGSRADIGADEYVP